MRFYQPEGHWSVNQCSSVCAQNTNLLVPVMEKLCFLRCKNTRSHVIYISMRFYISVSVHHKSIIYNKSTRYNSGSIVFINNCTYPVYVSDALCVHRQEHYKLLQQPLVCHELGWSKSCIDIKVCAHCTIPWPKCHILAM